MIIVRCKMPHAPEGAEFIVYHEGLTPGFDIGVEDSEKRRNWLLDMGTFLRMAYPADMDDGTVFIVSGATPLREIVEDFSAFESISVELRGATGGESVTISIEDSTNTLATPQFVINLGTSWKTYTFPFERFGNIDKSILRNVIRFGFSSPCANIVDVRDVRYLKRTEKIEAQPVYIYAASLLAPGYEIGDTTSSGRTDILKRNCDFFTINYPAGQEWGAVFIYTKKPQDFSSFDTLSIDMKGENGGEEVNIGISDILTSSNILRFYSPVTIIKQNEWRSYRIALDDRYRLVDRSHLHVAAAFLLRGNTAQTIHFRNIMYLK